MQHKSQTATFGLTLAALGVVFGDIGTSPLYAFKEAFAHGGLSVNPHNVYAVLSLILWSVLLVVTIKYVMIVMRFDNEGEGGILALVAYVQRHLQQRASPASAIVAITLLGLFAAALFYGDAIITPAISVLSAVEGLELVEPKFERWVLPVTIAILTGLFALQRFGTSEVGRYFGPVTVIWFLTLGVLGAISVAETPQILAAANPSYALSFAIDHPDLTFIALGAVFLTLTGAEALYADMGHFGAKPIRWAWFVLVLPCLMLNYFGQGALVLRHREAVENPFFLLAPDELKLPLVLLATAATVIASQATISGAFSMTLQAIRMGYAPRLRIIHTSDEEKGQIYVPAINTMMLVLVIWLVLEFRSSTALASAYGIAVCGTMFATTILVMVLLFTREIRFKFLIGLLLLGLLGMEAVFLYANGTKFYDGGWFPLMFGTLIFTLLTTFRTGMEFVDAQRDDFPLDVFLHGVPDITRVSGTAVFMTPHFGVVPGTLLHNLKHNQVLHEQVLLMNVTTEDVPSVHDRERINVIKHAHGMIEVQVRYGFREQPNIPHVIKLLEQRSISCDMMNTSFFLGKTIMISRPSTEGLFSFRRKLFAWMLRVGGGAPEYYQLPPNRVLEIGQQVVI